ncbi:MAG: ABC transporter substrate-binding protein, partial [Cytophagaceae bacterium]|nr:ABC transporter substrate-binding protein [Cytophagaceae bacterium]
MLFICYSCSYQSKQQNGSVYQPFGKPDSVYQPRYSNGFKISYYGVDKIVEVYNPWDSLASQCFYISNSGNSAAGNIPVINAPVANWSAFSSSQIVMAQKLGVLNTLTSVAEPQYISNSTVKKRLAEKSIQNIGMATEPDVELLLVSQPQFIFVSLFKDNEYESLHDAGLITVSDAGYMEASPLGRVEWIVFFGAFFNKEQEALKIFGETEEAYLNVKAKLKNVSEKPSVISGYLYQDVWFLPAGESYIATLFCDAGAIYPYSDTKGTGSLAYDFEKTFHDTHNCDFWMITVNHQGSFTYADFEAMDVRYADFKAFN